MNSCFHVYLPRTTHDCKYLTTSFKPVVSFPGTVTSVDSVGWNRNPIQQSRPFNDYRSPASWHSAALRSRSVGPGFTNSSGDVMSTVCPSDRRFITLQRQHRSLDGMQVEEYDRNEISNMLPLDVTTTNAPVPSSRYATASLSNPTSTNAYFWKQASGSQPYAYGTFGTPDPQAVQAYEMLKQDYEMAMQKLNSTMSSIKTFWSPELKRERQLRKEEASKLAALQRQIGSHGSTSFRVSDLENQLENCRCELAEKEEAIRRLMEHTSGTAYRDDVSRLAELETRCSQLESMLEIREEQIRSMGQHVAQLSLSSPHPAKDQRIADLEEELSVLRSERADLPRDFTDKTITPHEVNTLRLKMEKSEVELAQKTAELSAALARLQTATEAIEDLRKRVEVFRESSSAKEKHATLLHSDIEALRAKLETKNTQIEQKERICERLEAELTVEKGRVSDLRDTNRTLEQKITQLIARLDALECLLREKETELGKTKQELHAHPDIQKEEELQLQVDEAKREKARMQSLVDEIRRSAEKEKVQQLEAFQAQNQKLTATIESLQKELADRQVLLESQNEKIGDLDRELISVERQRKDRVVQPSNDEELAEARKEIESLLRMVQGLEKEKLSLISQCKQLQSRLEDVHKDELVASVTQLRPEISTVSTEGSLKTRVEELEEALRESVSITAERELHVAQQKQLSQQLASQLSECRHELNELRRHVKKMSTSKREEMLRSLEAEKKKHIEQLLQLKHETLVAAIAEKDAHIAILEQSRERPREEIETLRYHKEKLMEKLKEENERRAQLLNATDLTIPGDLLQEEMSLPAPLISASSVSAPAIVASSRPVVEQEDDAEGIWA